MSATLTPVITSAGLNAVFNAQNNGLDATITEIALGDSAWTPDNTATALQNEKRRITVSGERIKGSQIHLTGVEDGTSLEYWVREVGFYLADGTLLAIWSNANQALAYKSAGVDLLLAFDLVLSALPANSVTVDGSAGFNLPPATGSKRGLIRIATQAEITAGTATDVAINPAQLGSQLLLSSPAGAVIAFAANTPPSGWVECNGAALSRTAYADLFTAISTVYGAGDGATTFNLPDLRGEFIRGFDNGRGVDSGRNVGSWQAPSLVNGDAGTNNNLVTLRGLPGARGDYAWEDPLVNGHTATKPNGGYVWGPAQAVPAMGSIDIRLTGVVRPRNIAMMFCIKY